MLLLRVCVWYLLVVGNRLVLGLRGTARVLGWWMGDLLLVVVRRRLHLSLSLVELRRLLHVGVEILVILLLGLSLGLGLSLR